MTSSGSQGLDLFRVALDGLAAQPASGATLLGVSAAQAKAKLNWRQVASHAKSLGDPWKDLVRETRVERALEHEYDVGSKSWSARPVLVRVNSEKPVAKGRMRECFRAKKIALPHEQALQVEQDDSEADVDPVVAKIVRQLSEGSLDYALDYGVEQIEEWADMCTRSIVDVVPKVGRRTACRIRTRLGLEAVGYSHPTILTLQELMDCVRMHGPRRVELAFTDECHGFDSKDTANLHQMIKRGTKDAKGWQHASLNVMAKRYMASKDDVREVYEDDVVMQEVCKTLVQRFNSWEPAPPKQIDMLHVGVIQLVERPGKPCMGYESFVEGDYHKWNTNSGWRDEEQVRHTPHAFSFASFRLTEGELMVVDMQGVGDLYTDPQVHSCNGEGFGEGNLGARGMALFLRSFRYDLNPIVQYMEFAPFALLDGELPPPTAHEKTKFIEGRRYLNSNAWAKRRQNSHNSHSSRFSDQVDEESDDDQDDDKLGLQAQADIATINRIPDFLLTAAEEWTCPQSPPIKQCIFVPSQPCPEAEVHAALAKLYEEQDERVVVEGQTCSATEALAFHTWMAALAGSVPCMLSCATLAAEREDRKSALAWCRLAADRGSRAACELALQHIDAPSDPMLAIFYLQTALECDDGKTDLERKADFELCSFNLHDQLATCFLALGDTARATSHCQQAADLAMEAGDFRLSQRLQERLEELSS